MAPLPPNSTPRFRVKYTNVAHQHTMEIRSHESPSIVGDLVNDLFTEMSPLLFPTVIDSLEFAADNSNIFNPVTAGVVGNTYGSGSPFVQNAAWFISYIGRTSGGRRVRLYFFGVSQLGVDYRFPAAENADVDATRAVLGAAGGEIVGIDDLVPVWKSYANAGVNAYWQRNLRP